MSAGGRQSPLRPATSRWVANRDTVLFLGPPGVGKTHLAVALGREAITRGYSVLFTPATSMVASLAKAHVEGHLEERLIHYSKPKVLIVDELGRMLLTSNRSVGEWGEVLGVNSGCRLTADKAQLQEQRNSTSSQALAPARAVVDGEVGELAVGIDAALEENSAYTRELLWLHDGQS